MDARTRGQGQENCAAALTLPADRDATAARMLQSNAAILQVFDDEAPQAETANAADPLGRQGAAAERAGPGGEGGSRLGPRKRRRCATSGLDTAGSQRRAACHQRTRSWARKITRRHPRAAFVQPSGVATRQPRDDDRPRHPRHREHGRMVLARCVARYNIGVGPDVRETCDQLFVRPRPAAHFGRSPQNGGSATALPLSSRAGPTTGCRPLSSPRIMTLRSPRTSTPAPSAAPSPLPSMCGPCSPPQHWVRVCARTHDGATAPVVRLCAPFRAHCSLRTTAARSPGPTGDARARAALGRPRRWLHWTANNHGRPQLGRRSGARMVPRVRSRPSSALWAGRELSGPSH